MEGISRKDRIWMRLMEDCRRYFGCHQMPERSFFLGEYQFPLCARCTGIVIGHIVGVAVSLFYTIPLFSLAAAVPLMIDGTVQKFSRYESNNRRRLITGILYGFAVMSALITCCKKLSARIRGTSSRTER